MDQGKVRNLEESVLPPPRALRLVCGLCCVALAWGGLWVAAAPVQVSPVEMPAGSALTDHVTLEHGPGAVRRLRWTDRSIWLGPGQTAHWSGGTVVALTEDQGGVTVEMMDPTGRRITTQRVDAAADQPPSQLLAFGDALVRLPKGLHEPGLPYRVEILAPQRAPVIEHPDRTISSLRPLERHLTIHSVDADGGTLRSDVIDRVGRTRWSFTARERITPRVVANRHNAVALYPQRTQSQLVVKDLRGNRSQHTLSGRFTNVAAIDGHDAWIVWGRREVARVGREGLAWQVALDTATPEQLIASDTSEIRVVGGTVSLVTRSRAASRTGWSVALVTFDAADGKLIGRQALTATADKPTWIRRYTRDKRERIVMRDAVFEIAPAARQP